MRGDDVAEYAVSKYADMVLRIAAHNLKNRPDAEDAMQEVFLRLIRSNGETFENEEHLKNWLIRVTVNVCKNHWKSAWVQKNLPLDDSQISDAAASFPAETIELLEALWSLRRKQRNIIYLYYYEGYTVPEISNMMGLKTKTVYTQLDRARKQLKGILLEGEENT